MHAAAREADGDFRACQIVQASGLGRCCCAVLPADFIMVGQRPQFHTSLGGTLRQLLGGQCAVGHDRVAVQIGVEVGFGHGFIVGGCARRMRCIESMVIPVVTCNKIKLLGEFVDEVLNAAHVKA